MLSTRRASRASKARGGPGCAIDLDRNYSGSDCTSGTSLFFHVARNPYVATIIPFQWFPVQSRQLYATWMRHAGVHFAARVQRTYGEAATGATMTTSDHNRGHRRA